MVYAFITFIAAAIQDGPPRTPPSLTGVVGAYSKVRGYRMVADVTNRLVGGQESYGDTEAPLPGPPQEALVIDYGAPNSWRIQSSANPLVLVHKEKRTFLVPGVGGGLSPGEGGGKASVIAIEPLDYRTVRQGLSSTRTLRTEDVSLNGEQVRCSVIEATYSSDGLKWGRDPSVGGPPDAGQFQMKQRTYWVDVKRAVIIREVDAIEGAWWPRKSPTPLKARYERTLVAQELEWDETPPASTFAVGPPPGTLLPDGSVTTGRNGEGPPLTPVVDACQNIADPWSKSICLQTTQFQSCTHPPLSAEIKTARLAGCEDIRFTVDGEGRTTNVVIREGVGLGLDEEAAACVSQWRYRPPQKDGSNPNSGVVIERFGAYNYSSLWHLMRVEFNPSDGATRPIFMKTRYPWPAPTEQVSGFSVFHVHLIVGKDGTPHNVQVVPSVNAKLDKVAIGIVAKWRFRPGEADGKPADVPATFWLGLGYNGYCHLN